MSRAPARHITQLLQNWTQRDQAALQELMPLLHAELRRLAHRYMAREGPGHLLQTTALVHEAYVRLIDFKNIPWQDRAHFFGVSAQLMRRILVDYARSRNYLKRGGGMVKVSLGAADGVTVERAADFVALDDALERLAALDPRKSRIVELRFFGGLSVEETAEVLKVSPRTIKREFSLAQAWLYRELGTSSPRPSRPSSS